MYNISTQNLKKKKLTPMQSILTDVWTLFVVYALLLYEYEDSKDSIA